MSHQLDDVGGADEEFTPQQQPKNLSKCHNAPVTIGGIGDFRDSDRAVTQYYVCTKCEKACDIVPQEQPEEDN